MGGNNSGYRFKHTTCPAATLLTAFAKVEAKNNLTITGV